MSWSRPKVYAAIHKDELIRGESRSGGIFTALSDQILQNGGVVYGCVLTEDFQARHIRAENQAERNRMRGSKYIQSKLGDIFKVVRQDLEEGKQVLFSGTSCQIAGLQLFLGKEYKNLRCLDIVCHGVPSIKVWNSYLDWQEKKNQSKVKRVDFRNKTDFGWKDHIETLWFENEEVEHSRVFTTMFYGHSILRPSCYECPFKSVIHPGNLTIADYWGIENAAPEFDDNRGVSLVLINDDIGKEMFEEVKDCLIWKQIKLEDSLQPPLKGPFPRPMSRERFWKDFNNKPFEYVVKKYGQCGIKSKIKTRIKKILQCRK